MSRLAPIGPTQRAALLAALGLALTAPSAAAQDPAALVEAEIPRDSAISEQYQRVQDVLDEAAAVVPDTPISQPAADPEPVAEPAPAPKPPPPPSDQYHSETPSNVSVTQTQPSNVNVSIRINSPGDDGPVVQINNAGGSAVVEQVQQVVQRPTPRPEPEPVQAASGGLPDSWDWTWTSACFGGAPRAGAATAMPGWNWHWSCDDQAGGDEIVPDLPGMPRLPDPGRAVMDVLAAAGPTFAALMPSAAVAPERPRARPDRRRRSGPSSDVAGGAGPPPPAGRAPPAQPLLAGASAHAPPATAAPPRHSERAAAHARPGPEDGSTSNFPPGESPGLGAASALGSVASLLLGIWLAVLVTACVIVLPRLRHRRWSGLTWRLPRQSSPRLERPG